jgi:uncharacterized membrane protein
MGNTPVRMMGPGPDLVTAILGSAVSLLWLVVLSWVALRIFGCRRRDGLGRARAVLHRRLASGEIGVEEYYEREAALRQAAPAQPRRRLLRGP